jgi:hypothetical protein
MQEVQGAEKVLFGADDFNLGHADDHDHPPAGQLPDAASRRFLK